MPTRFLRILSILTFFDGESGLLGFGLKQRIALMPFTMVPQRGLEGGLKVVPNLSPVMLSSLGRVMSRRFTWFTRTSRTC